MQNDIEELNKNMTGMSVEFELGYLLYYFVISKAKSSNRVGRDSEPFIIIETGTNKGYSSICMALALRDADINGKIFTMDVTDFGTKSWIDKFGLNAKFEFKLGNSLQLLPELIKNIKYCDVFFHDSQHSFQTAVAEFDIVKDKIYHEGIALFHDIYTDHRMMHIYEYMKSLKDWNTVIFPSNKGLLLSVRK